MQNRPDHPALLEAVAKFLVAEVKPSITDPAVAFRVLVAANLLAVVAAEDAVGEAQELAELERLQRLLGMYESVRGTMDRKGALATMNQALVAKIRSGLGDDERRPIWEHVMLTLRGELFLQSPRFDPSIEVEKG